MKNFVKMVVDWVTVSFSVCAGAWLWNEVAEDKACNLKDRLTKRFSKEEEES